MNELTNLISVKTDEFVKVVKINGGYDLRKKLSLRGIFPGKIIRVISIFGPVTVEVNRSMVSIGSGMAQKIKVERLTD